MTIEIPALNTIGIGIAIIVISILALIILHRTKLKYAVKSCKKYIMHNYKERANIAITITLICAALEGGALIVFAQIEDKVLLVVVAIIWFVAMIIIGIADDYV